MQEAVPCPKLFATLAWLVGRVGKSTKVVNIRELARELECSNHRIKRQLTQLEALKMIEIAGTVAGTSLGRGYNTLTLKFTVSIRFDNIFRDTLVGRRWDVAGTTLGTASKYDESRSPCDVGVVIPMPKPESAPKNGPQDCPPEQPQTKTPPKRSKRPDKASKSGAVVQAYFDAMEAKYGVRPRSSAKINSIACRLIDEIGEDDSVEVVKFYVTHNNSWYVQKGHQIEWCYKDAQKLRTEWLAGVQVTSTMAREVDRHGATDQNIKQYLRMKRQADDVEKVEVGF